jgi:hypothetical protein
MRRFLIFLAMAAPPVLAIFPLDRQAPALGLEDDADRHERALESRWQEWTRSWRDAANAAAEEQAGLSLRMLRLIPAPAPALIAAPEPPEPAPAPMVVETAIPAPDAPAERPSADLVLDPEARWEDLQKQVADLIDGFVLPSFDGEPLREKLRGLAAENTEEAASALLRIVDDTASIVDSIRAQRQAVNQERDKAARGVGQSETRWRKAEVLEKRSKILARQLERLDQIWIDLLCALRALSSPESRSSLAERYGRLKNVASKEAVIDVLVEAGSVLLSNLAVEEPALELLERIARGIGRTKRVSETAARKLLGAAASRKNPLTLRVVCIDALRRAKAGVAVDALIDLMGDPDLSIREETHDALSSITGASVPPSQAAWKTWRANFKRP